MAQSEVWIMWRHKAAEKERDFGLVWIIGVV